MNKITLVLFLALITTFSAKAQVLTVGENGSVEVKSGATLNAGGLEISPDADYTIAGANSIEKALTAISIDGLESMARHYEAAEDLTGFTGTIVYNYEDADMNGIDHFAALQILDTSDGSWMNYADEDSADYTVTHAFADAVQIKAVTANDATLSIETVDGNMSIRDLNREKEWKLPDEEANTVAGLVIHEAQTIPTAGQVFNFNGFRYEVLSKEKNRLTQIKITKMTQ